MPTLKNNFSELIFLHLFFSDPDELLFDEWDTIFLEYQNQSNSNSSLDWLFEYFYKSYGEIDIRQVWFDFSPKRLKLNFVFQPKNIMEVKMMERAISRVSFQNCHI